MTKTIRKQTKTREGKQAILTAESLSNNIEELIDQDHITSKDLDKIPMRIEKLPLDNVLSEKLIEKGMTPDKVADWLMELCNWKTQRYDKQGNCYESIDGNLRLKAIEIWSKITGNDSKVGTTHNHLHLEKLPNGKLAELARKANTD